MNKQINDSQMDRLLRHSEDLSKRSQKLYEKGVIQSKRVKILDKRSESLIAQIKELFTRIYKQSLKI